MEIVRHAALVVLLCALLAPPAGAAAPHLDEDATEAVQGWAERLERVEVVSIQSERERVVVQLAGDCDILISHPADPACTRVRTLGNSVVCLQGAGCPSEATQKAALEAAGRLTLPWRMPDEEGEVQDAEERMEALRTRLIDALEAGDTETAQKALAQAIRTEDAPPEALLDVLPLAPSLGSARDAWGVVTSERVATLGAEVVTVLRVSLLMGAGPGAEAGRAVVRPEIACELASVARGYLRAHASRPAARLAEACREAAPECAEASEVASEARERVRARGRLRAVPAEGEEGRWRIIRVGDEEPEADGGE
ncbi:MAG: hypothetical protein ACQEXJ_01870 [Myxococcota bacterium]